MKFLLEFVSCYGTWSRKLVEETKSLVPEARRDRGRKRGRLAAVRTVSGGGSGNSQVAEWKPTLSVISEDNMLPERKETVGSGKAKRKKPSIVNKARSHHYREEFGRAPISAIMPVWAPTPFLF